MSYVLLAMMGVGMIFACFSGSGGAMSAALMGGAQSAVELAISICGGLCLWSGIMEVMSESGISESLAGLLRPLLRRLYPRAFEDEACARAISENFSANLLGLGNAATPAGIRAVKLMARSTGKRAEAELSRLVVMNTASVQLIPATVAALRAGLGCSRPFDILPCVWISSAVSVAVGLLTAKFLEKLWP